MPKINEATQAEETVIAFVDLYASSSLNLRRKLDFVVRMTEEELQKLFEEGLNP